MHTNIAYDGHLGEHLHDLEPDADVLGPLRHGSPRLADKLGRVQPWKLQSLCQPSRLSVSPCPYHVCPSLRVRITSVLCSLSSVENLHREKTWLKREHLYNRPLFA